MNMQLVRFLATVRVRSLSLLALACHDGVGWTRRLGRWLFSSVSL